MRTFLLLSFVLLCTVGSCGKNPDPTPTPEPEPQFYAKGADIGWCTEMESKGNKFYNTGGREMECTALMKECGFNSVRIRVWVNPADGWCNKEDVLEKARRAQNLGMKVMIDFHYGDSWCDPQKQPIPAAWKGHTADQLAEDVSGHTEEVLELLKSKGIDVQWVQVGNEVTNGFLWETCRVAGSSAENFMKVFKSGADAVKSVYTGAKVVLHIDNGWNLNTLKWFLDLVSPIKDSYDVLGLSLYPSYWDSSIGGYPDWKEKTSEFVNNLSKLYSLYRKEIILVEFGMPASQPEQTRDALNFIFENTSEMEFFTGLFYWEPESEKSRNGYDYGAFKDGMPTVALEPFKTK